MRIIGLFILLYTTASLAQVDMSETEKLQKTREANRKEDALRDEALKPNEKQQEAKKLTLI